MGLIFKEEGHVYESIDEDKIDWTSVTSSKKIIKE